MCIVCNCHHSDGGSWNNGNVAGCEVLMRYFKISVEFDADTHNVPKLETTIQAKDIAEVQSTASELFPQATGIAIWEV